MIDTDDFRAIAATLAGMWCHPASEKIIEAADELEKLRDLLRRAEREMADMYWCAQCEQPPHDGDDFHELWMEIHSVLGMDTKARARAALGEE